MDLTQLQQQAFALCQAPYVATEIVPIPMLDPPTEGGGREALGLVYLEELEIRTRTILDEQGFYFLPKPRAGLNVQPWDVFVSDDGGFTYRPFRWEDAPPDYSSPAIQPPIDRNRIPPEGRVLTELIVGHRAPDGSYPQLFNLRSNGYLRFSGYPPQVMGASLRVGAHRIFGTALDDNPDHEDFPVIRAIYASIRSPGIAHAYLLVESQFFCGALSVDMIEGVHAIMDVDGYWYTRGDFSWQDSPHTAFVAYSSMMWLNESHTPEYDGDEAHDSDTLRVRYRDGERDLYRLDLPDEGVRVQVFGDVDSGHVPVEWVLANEDRDPAHYFVFEGALGNTNFQWRASYLVEILESDVRTAVAIYEQATDVEYEDNIVAASVIRQDIAQPRSVEEAVRFRYRTIAFMEYP